MAVIGGVKTFDHRFLFQVEVDGFLSASFSKAGPLRAEVAENKHYEGGSLIPTKSFGRVDFKDIEFERGKTIDFDFYLWFSTIVNAAANAGATEAVAKRHLDIVQRDRDGSLRARYSVFGAWPKMYEAGEWDNNSDELVIEKMTIAYDYYIKTL